jgi:hypothetical protein
MEQVIKNSVLLGVGLVFIFFFYGIVSTQKNHERLEEAESFAENEALKDAAEDLKNGRYILMIRTGGFSPLDIPEIDPDRLSRCYEKVVELKEFDQISCVPIEKSYEEIVNNYLNTPDRTSLYAEVYNRKVTEFLDLKGISKCN